MNSFTKWTDSAALCASIVPRQLSHQTLQLRSFLWSFLGSLGCFLVFVLLCLLSHLDSPGLLLTSLPIHPLARPAEGQTPRTAPQAVQLLMSSPIIFLAYQPQQGSTKSPKPEASIQRPQERVSSSSAKGVPLEVQQFLKGHASWKNLNNFILFDSSQDSLALMLSFAYTQCVTTQSGISPETRGNPPLSASPSGRPTQTAGCNERFSAS